MEHETHAEHRDPSYSHLKKKDDLPIPLAIVIAGALIGGAIFFSNSNTPTTTSLALPAISAPVQQPLIDAGTGAAPVSELALRADDHVLGNPAAPVLIIEYSDTECPFCKRFHETMHQVMDQYGKGEKVAWVYRHSPIDQLHPRARKEAEALECANELGGNDAFWKYTDKLFEITPSNNGLDPTQLPIIASLVGLDATAFNACLSSGKYADRVQKDFENGVSVGAKGTPFSVVWNRKTGKQMPIAGAYPFSDVKSAIDTVVAFQVAPLK